MTKKQTTLDKFLAWVNETFQPENPEYLSAVKVNQDYMITSEVSVVFPDKETILPVCHYYEHGYPWIHPLLVSKAKEMGLRLEWRDPSAVLVYGDL